MRDVDVTYPPELLPLNGLGEEAEVYVQDTLHGDGKNRTRLVWSSAHESTTTKQSTSAQIRDMEASGRPGRG